MATQMNIISAIKKSVHARRLCRCTWERTLVITFKTVCSVPGRFLIITFEGTNEGTLLRRYYTFVVSKVRTQIDLAPYR